MSNVRTHVTHRPPHIWLVLALLAAFTLWLFYGVVAAASYFSFHGLSLSLMAAYIPKTVGACACAVAWVALFQRRRWARWLFLLPVAAAVLQLLALAPYVLIAIKLIADPAGKASVFHVLIGFLQPVIFLLVAMALAVSVFRYLRAAIHSPAIEVNVR